MVYLCNCKKSINVDKEIVNNIWICYKQLYIKESGVCYNTYNSRSAEPIWLKIDGEVP